MKLPFLLKRHNVHLCGLCRKPLRALRETKFVTRYSLIAVLFVLALIGCSDPVRIVKFNTLPETPFKGDTVWVFWAVENATEVTLDGKNVSDSGAIKVLLDRTRTFELKAKGPRSEAVNRLNIVAE